ncbi:unnamed protein product [Colias eurytheme]|nr:unnamed protein product [Colias eurytheme]
MCQDGRARRRDSCIGDLALSGELLVLRPPHGERAQLGLDQRGGASERCGAGRGRGAGAGGGAGRRPTRG